MLRKNGDQDSLKSYHPICMLSHISKLFTGVISDRLVRLLDTTECADRVSMKSLHNGKQFCFEPFDGGREGVQSCACPCFLSTSGSILPVECIDGSSCRGIKATNKDSSTDVTLFTNIVSRI